MIDEERILQLVRSDDYRAAGTAKLAERLSVPRAERQEFAARLQDLQRRGLLAEVKDQWVDPDRAGLIIGRLQCNARGFGFLLPARQEEEQEDVYVAEEDMRSAMHDDLVIVELHSNHSRGRRGKRLGPSGRVIKVIEHRNHEIIGTFAPGKNWGRVMPDNPRLFHDVYVPRDDWMGAEEGQEVVVQITEWPTLHRNPEGVITRVLGRAGAPGVDVESVIFEFNLPREFSDEVLHAAEHVTADLTREERSRRRDMRGHTTLTIDPEDAKDFDDALSFYRDPDSGRRVALVHIADLSHHIEPDDVLDLEARERGTSVYLANQVVPMLPHELSKHTLSLVEGEDRAAKTAVIEFDEDGSVHRYEICHSVIHVDRRMSYVEVQNVLEGAESEGFGAGIAYGAVEQDVLDALDELDALAQQLRVRRRRIGSIDLDVPDYHVDVDQHGHVVAVSQIIRDRSHGLVEELMLSANRVVADFLCENELPGLFRVHGEPLEEDLEEFASFIQTVLHRQIDALDRRQLQELLADVAGTHVADAVNMQLLRAMQRAVYTTSVGPHFALHFDRYCHFTSPVRRYPDLVVHQILDRFLRDGVPAGKLRGQWGPKLSSVATHCNETQERADNAEREIIKIKLLRFLEEHRDEVFEGVVTGVLEIGMFVRLEHYSVEGLVKVEDIHDDFYKLQEKRQALVGTNTGRTFQLGDTVRVVIEDIDMAHRQLDLLLHE